MTQSEPCGESPPVLIAIEFRLDWLIHLADIPRADPGRRLNAVENLTGGMLARMTGLRRRIRPGSDLRLSPCTYAELARWVEQRAPAVGDAQVRLLEYAEAARSEDSVLDGWVRVTVGP